MSELTPLVDVLLRQGQSWRSGERMRIEDILVRYPHLAGDNNALLDLIYNEVILREELGQKPALNDYLERFPAVATELKAQFEVDQALAMEELTRSASPSQRTISNALIPTGRPDWLHGFDLIEEVGRGATGVVWRAWQKSARRIVAVKLLSLDVPPNRVQTEIDAVTRLSHPNILPIFEVREDVGRTALILEFANGGSLAARMAGKPQPIADVVILVETLARAMHHAHERGVVHRDLKPSNVLLATDEDTPLGQCVPRIADFGLAKLVESDQQLTRTNDILGTPSYMAPEQTGGRQVGPATDIYALGAILYEGLTGRPPFLGESVLHTLEQVRNQEPVPPSHLRPDVALDLDVICLKCLHKLPARRYASARELAEDLRHFLANEPIRARAVGLAERAWKWSSRHPAVAASAVLGFVAALVLLVVGVWVNRTLRGQRDLAVKQAGEQATQVEQMRRLVYAGQLLRIAELASTDPQQGLRLLEDPRGCPPDLRCFSWGILYAQCKRYSRDWAAHERAVTALAISPTGAHVATASSDGWVKVWDAATHELCAAMHEHSDQVKALAFSADGATLASGGDDGLIRLWNVPSGSLRNTFRLPSRRITALVFLHKDPRILASLAVENGSATAQLWNLQNAAVRRVIATDLHPRSGLALSPDGTQLACADHDHAVRLYLVSTGRQFLQLAGENKHKALITALAFSSDSRLLVSGAQDGGVRLWSPDRIHPLQESIETGVSVTNLAVHPQSQTIAVGGARDEADGEGGADLQLWDVLGRRGEEPARAHGGVSGLAYAPDGNSLLTAGSDGTVKVWAHPARRESFVMRDAVGKANTVSLSPEGRVLAWVRQVRNRHEIDIFDLRQGTLDAVLHKFALKVRGVAVLASGQMVVSAHGNDGEPPDLLLWNARTGELKGALHGHKDAVTALAAGPGVRDLVTVCRDGNVTVWDVETGKQRLAVREASVNWQSAAFAANGGHVAAGASRLIRVWQIDGGRSRHIETGGAVQCLALSPDGERVAWAADSGEVHLDGMRLATGMKKINALAFSADGKALVVAGSGSRVRLWDVQSGQERAALAGHRGGASYASFAADGRMLFTAGAAGQGRVWYRFVP